MLIPTVHSLPTLIHLAQIKSSPSTPLSELNRKTAFLLTTAAFLRPSDPKRISLQYCQVDSGGDLQLTIMTPKELRAGRRIIKCLLVRKNHEFKELCPVQAFLALRNQPSAQENLPKCS
jgi:hypothetical protein